MAPKVPILWRALLLAGFLSMIVSGASDFPRGKAAPQLGHLRTGEALPSLTVYVIAPPAPGHLTPLISIASELQTRGHNVTFFSLVRKGAEGIPRDALRKAGIVFRSLGFTPTNRTEFQKIIEDMNTGANLLGNILPMMEEDAVVLVAMQEILLADPAALPDVLVVDYSLKFMGEELAETLGLRVVFNHALCNYLFPPDWPFPAIGSGLPKLMSFWQRLENEVVKFVNNVLVDTYLVRVVLPKIRRQYGLPLMAAARRSIFGLSPYPAMLNTAPGLDFPSPLPANVIYVGGLVGKARDIMPDTLQSWLDTRAPRSVVLISLGTENVLTKEMALVIFEGLGGLQEDVLWTLNENYWGVIQSLPVPANFRMEKWIPQRAVLAHKAVAAMVSHCGNNGPQEALSNGVPVVGMPFFADQFDVAARLRHMGFTTLDQASVTSIELRTAVQSVTDVHIGDATDRANGTNRHKQTAQKLARMLAAYGGARTAADFVEHVAEFGYDHLRMAVFDMPWWVKSRVDTSLFFGVVLMGVLVGSAKLSTIRKGRHLVMDGTGKPLKVPASNKKVV